MTIKGVEETSSRASDSGEFSLQAGIQIFALRSKLRNPCQCLLDALVTIFGKVYPSTFDESEGLWSEIQRVKSYVQ